MITVATIVRYLTDARATESALRRLIQTQVLASVGGDYRDLLLRHLAGADARGERVASRLDEVADRRGNGHLGSGAPQGVFNGSGALALDPIGLAHHGTRDERLLRNAKTVYAAEAFGTVTYEALETVCRHGDDERTAALAAELCDEQEQLLAELRGLLPALATTASGAGSGGLVPS